MTNKKQSIEEVMSFCSISETEATKLLNHFDWSTEDAINTFLTDPTIVQSIGPQGAVADISLNDTAPTLDISPAEPDVIETDVLTTEPDDGIYEEEDEPSLSEIKSWNSTKLEKMFCPPEDFLTDCNLFIFLKQMQEVYKKSNSHLFSKKESPKRPKSEMGYFIPIVFVKDNEDFLSQSIYRDILKHQSIVKKLTKHFRCIEIEFKDEATKLFCKKYSVKHDMCLMFLHPLTWELIDVVYRVDLKNKDVIKGIIENIIDKIYKSENIKDDKNTDRENGIELEDDGSKLKINTEVKLNDIKKEDKVKFKVYSEFGQPTFIHANKGETVEDLIKRTFIHFNKEENQKNYKFKGRSPIANYFEGKELLSSLVKYRELILVNINK